MLTVWETMWLIWMTFENCLASYTSWFYKLSVYNVNFVATQKNVLSELTNLLISWFSCTQQYAIKYPWKQRPAYIQQSTLYHYYCLNSPIKTWNNNSVADHCVFGPIVKEDLKFVEQNGDSNIII